MSDSRPVVAILGGSFSPPHVGHAFVLGWLHWTAKASRIIVVPTFHHALKEGLAPWADRVRMTQALVDSVLPHYAEVSTLEAEREGPSYTVDTLDIMAAKYPWCRIRLVVGSDVLSEVDKWHRWDRILAEYDPIIIPRGYSGGVGTTPTISSTTIRKMIREGQPLDDLVPAHVLEVMDPHWYRV